MTELPSTVASRLATPSWLDGRLLLGVVLVLVSVVVGGYALAAADASRQVYVVRADLAAGTTLTADDIGVGRVRLFDNGEAYVDAAGPSPVGATLVRRVGAGELLPRDAVLPADNGPPARLVTVPVPVTHAPAELRRGALVDVFATYGQPGQSSRTVAVVRRVPVQGDVGARGGLAGGSSERGVVLRVAPDEAARLVAAVQTARIDLVQVVDGATSPDVGTDPVVVGGAGAQETPAATPAPLTPAATPASR